MQLKNHNLSSQITQRRGIGNCTPPTGLAGPQGKEKQGTVSLFFIIKHDCCHSAMELEAERVSELPYLACRSLGQSGQSA